MMYRKFYIYPLLLVLITIFALPGLTTAASLQVLIHALDGRLAQLGQGTIRYDYYRFKCARVDFHRIKEAFDQKAAGVSIRERNNRLCALLYRPSIDRVTTYRGTIYYKAQGKQWRLVKKNIKGHGLSVKDLEHLAAKKFPNLAPGEKVKVYSVMRPVDEDVSYDGKTLLRLENNKTLIKSGVMFGLNYPTIQTLDISLAPWYMALENPPLANQTITVKAHGSLWSISYLDRLIGGRITNVVNQNVVYEFDAAKGFVPVRIYGTENNKTIFETLFHCHKARGNEYIIDSILAFHYPAAKQDKLGGEVYLIKSWSNKVTAQDLKVKLPRKYQVEKYGEASPVFKIIGENNSKQKK